MFQRNFVAGLVLVASLFFPFLAEAVESNSPIGIGLVPPLQIPNSDYGIQGLRLGVVGINRSVSGLDFGVLGNITRQSFKGSAVSLLFNYNAIAADIVGFQVSALANINGAASTLYGVQLGLYNKVSHVYGIQIGLVNVTESLHGIQIGLMNFNSAGPFKFTPIINVGF